MSASAVETERPNFAPEQVADAAMQSFGISGELKALVSDRDQNFKISNCDAEYVFKIANRDESPDFLDLQNKSLVHLAQTAPDLLLPRLLPTLEGWEMTVLKKGVDRHLVRVLSYISGGLYSAVPKTTELFSSLGSYMGRLSRGLQGFGHPAAHRTDFLWNLDNVLSCEAYISDIASDDNRRIVKSYFERYRRHVMQSVPSLRSAVIHNDINDNNIIVSEDGKSVAAVIDFGDMVFASQINELATALAYALLEQDDILAVSKAIIGAYHKVFPLQELEADLLFDLVAMRLCMSVCISSRLSLIHI